MFPLLLHLSSPFEKQKPQASLPSFYDSFDQPRPDHENDRYPQWYIGSRWYSQACTLLPLVCIPFGFGGGILGVKIGIEEHLLLWGFVICGEAV